MSTKAEVAEKEPMKEETQSAEAKQAPKKSEGLASKLQKILETVEQLTVLELAQLVKALESGVGVCGPGRCGGSGSGRWRRSSGGCRCGRRENCLQGDFG